MIKLCLALLSLLLLGCAGPRADHRVTTSNDPWMAAGDEHESGTSRPVPPADFAVVPGAGRGEAVSMLAEREWVELPADSPLIPDDFPAGGGAIYLVRGLVLQGRGGIGHLLREPLRLGHAEGGLWVPRRFSRADRPDAAGRPPVTRSVAGGNVR